VQFVLSEVQKLRLLLGSDLTVAAAAAEAQREEIAADIVAADRAEVASFGRRSVARLLEAPTEIPAPRRRWVGLPSAPLLAAMAAVVALLAGIVPSSGWFGRAGVAPLTASFDSFRARFTTDQPAAQVLANVNATPGALAPLIAAAPTDPAAAERALALLQLAKRMLESQHLPDSAYLLAPLQQLLEQLQVTVQQSAHVPATNSPALVKVLLLPSPSPAAPGPSAAPKTGPNPSAPAHRSARTNDQPAAPSPTSSPSATASPSTSATPKPSPSTFPPLPGPSPGHVGIP
jgi:hypothetical protein